ncbi:uncharacterized protein BJ171DRAFT_507394 [Polychytrium aggregatum]|uniref:uncharacterized protein n=1 Tax=Polychytrium aggregatum TaxID=110093 RepID=UPI0022FF1230|nr:uncharacterized protein BJ171DRAFT_507394 [Polychytrium aggregatum]KAI9204016.1 hypothetical protein BJ171DRAFT_507394 [Polychytrium aggregatum]
MTPYAERKETPSPTEPAPPKEERPVSPAVISRPSRNNAFGRLPSNSDQSSFRSMADQRKDENKPPVKEVVQRTLSAMAERNVIPQRASAEALPSFEMLDLVDLLDRVLEKLEVFPTSHTPLSPETDFVPTDGSSPTAADFKILQVKIRTQNHIITELGRRIDRFKKSIEDLTGKVGQLSKEKEQLASECENLRKNGPVGVSAVLGDVTNGLLGLRRPGRLSTPSAAALEGKGNDQETGLSGLLDELELDVTKEELELELKQRALAQKQEHTARLQQKIEKEKQAADSTEPEISVPDPFARTDDGETPTKITREMLVEAARMISTKKQYDHPTTLGVGFVHQVAKDISQMGNPYHGVSRSPYQQEAPGYRSTRFLQLIQSTSDQTHHLALVIAKQTQELLATTTTEEYIRVIHNQFTEMTSAFYECLDVLAEEQRASERWRWKFEKILHKIERIERKRLEDQRERGLESYKRQYLLNALAPITQKRRARSTSARQPPPTSPSPPPNIAARPMTVPIALSSLQPPLSPDPFPQCPPPPSVPPIAIRVSDNAPDAVSGFSVAMSHVSASAPTTKHRPKRVSVSLRSSTPANDHTDEIDEWKDVSHQAPRASTAPPTLFGISPVGLVASDLKAVPSPAASAERPDELPQAVLPQQVLDSLDGLHLSRKKGRFKIQMPVVASPTPFNLVTETAPGIRVKSSKAAIWRAGGQKTKVDKTFHKARQYLEELRVVS